MKSLKKYHIAALFALMFLAVKGQNIEWKLNPTDDTYTYSDGTIRGMESMLKTYHSTAGSQYRRISFMKFDISTLTPFIQSVKLRLYCNGITAGGDNIHEFDLYPVKLNTWSEDNVTYSNYAEKLGADITSPLLSSYNIAAGTAFSAQYIEFTGNELMKYITDSVTAAKKYITIRMREKYVVKNGTSAVIVEFHSKENTSGFAPELIIVEKDVENLRASAISVNNQPLTGFTEKKYQYTYKVAYDATEIPIVTGTAKYPEANVTIIQATSLNGTIAERTAKISIQNGSDVLVYSVIFEKLPPPTEARLSAININGKPVEFFSMDNYKYTYLLPYSTEGIPTVTPVCYDPKATYIVTNAQSINESATENERTGTIVVTSANSSETKTYEVVFRKLPELDIVLAIGQSNMSGRAPFADVAEPMENVYLLTPAGEMEISSNPLNKYSNIRKDLSIQGLGPSYTCALTLRDYLKRSVGFVVNAQGGSSITTWYQPGKTNYDASISRAKEAQKFGRIKAIIWHQGSTDNSAGLEDNFVSYKSNLSKMVQNFRTDLKEPELFFICGELSERPEFDQFTEVVVHPVATYIPFSDYIVTDGTNLLSDGIHFDEPSAKLLGTRYAEKIINNVYITSNSNAYLDEMPRISKSSDGFLIMNKKEPVNLCVRDFSGKLIIQTNLDTNQVKNIKLKNGLYMFTLSSNDKTSTIKISNF